MCRRRLKCEIDKLFHEANEGGGGGGLSARAERGVKRSAFCQDSQNEFSQGSDR